MAIYTGLHLRVPEPVCLGIPAVPQTDSCLVQATAHRDKVFVPTPPPLQGGVGIFPLGAGVCLPEPCLWVAVVKKMTQVSENTTVPLTPSRQARYGGTSGQED
jgi:hypothetical protein